jgi:alpha-ketoglutarate-dependent 2,4-dichlorophenoxyacetate dioxygenase
MAIEVRVLTPVFGAEIVGVDLSAPLDEAGFAVVKAAFEEHSVLLFRGQHIEDEAQVAFTGLFGPPEEPRKSFVDVHDKPDLLTVANFDGEGNLYETDTAESNFRVGQRIWHTDGSFKARPSIASLLRACIVPPEGGHTQFASLRAAYNALPAEKQREYENSIAVHHFAHSRRHMGITFLSPEEEAKFPAMRHPMVRVNPVNGKKALYVSGYASHIEGMDQEVGCQLLEELLAFASQEAFVYDHRWAVGDLVMYDNRASLHRASEYAIGDFPRMLRRTNVAETQPTL